ncbi:MAG: hypothetical protein EON49_00145 [Acidovorax sp.]|nr:MAG: hypothetical protein EON49_00145 [Acidovorax sp.]
MQSRRFSQTSTKPQPTSGNLYYVRLSTSLGTFYKLGFTTLGSAQERFAYQGKGHDGLVDDVLLFVYRDDAYEVEQIIHAHFRGKASFAIPEEGMPFFENGQSEIYAEDILKLDWKSAEGDSNETRTNITKVRGKRAGRSDEEIREQLEVEKSIADVVTSLARAFRWIIRGYNKLEEWNASDNEKSRRARLNAVLVDLKAKSEENRRNWLRRRTRIISDPYAALQADVREAIAALKRKDLQGFENIIHVPLFAHNLAEAMTADFGFGSDYMGVANNCGMFALIEAMEKQSPRDLLLKPVQETYKAILRVLVKSHRLLREDLIMPDDPKYSVSEPEGDYQYDSLSNYYGPRNYLDLFGRDWSIDDNPQFDVKVGAVEFDVVVSNQETGFRGCLKVNAMYVSGHKISLSFPNFLDLEESAWEHRKKWEKSVGLRDPNEQDLPHRNYFRRMMLEEMREIDEMGE